MSSRLTRIALATVACASIAAPAAAQAASKSTTYRGKTREGNPISFRVTGSRISHLSAYVSTLCLATEGTPLSGTDPFDPPGSFRVGRAQETKAKRANAIWNTADVTKNFHVTTKRDRKGRITGKLHVDYSFLMIVFDYTIYGRPYVCTGDTTFHLSPAR
jgi:hypothetical protein